MLLGSGSSCTLKVHNVQDVVTNSELIVLIVFQAANDLKAGYMPGAAWLRPSGRQQRGSR